MLSRLWFRVKLAALWLLSVCGGCSIDTVERWGAGPICIRAEEALGPTCDDTTAAFSLLDDELEQAGLQAVSPFVHLVWLSGPSFVSPDGRHLWGHTAPALRIYQNGFTICDLEVADRDQPVVSNTSLSHEVTHCALALTRTDLSGDPDHSGPEWRPCGEVPTRYCGLVDRLNDRLRAGGL